MVLAQAKFSAFGKKEPGWVSSSVTHQCTPVSLCRLLPISQRYRYTNTYLIFEITIRYLGNWTLRFGSLNELGLVSGLNKRFAEWLVVGRTQERLYSVSGIRRNPNVQLLLSHYFLKLPYLAISDAPTKIDL